MIHPTKRKRPRPTALAAPRPLSFTLSIPGAGATSLTLPPQLPFPQWGRTLGLTIQVGTAARWWVGDACHYGEATYGEKYTQATADCDPDDLSRLVRVAVRVPPENRRADLSWSHHAEVARLGPAEQRRWLERAARARWTAKELRGQIQAAEGKPAKAAGDGLGLSCCPGCGCQGSKRTSICCKPAETAGIGNDAA